MSFLKLKVTQDKERLGLIFPSGQRLVVSRDLPLFEAWLASIRLDTPSSYQDLIRSADMCWKAIVPYSIAASPRFARFDRPLTEQGLASMLEPHHSLHIQKDYKSRLTGPYMDEDHLALVVESNQAPLFQQYLSATLDIIASQSKEALRPGMREYSIEYVQIESCINSFRPRHVRLEPKLIVGSVARGQEYALYKNRESML